MDIPQSTPAAEKTGSVTKQHLNKTLLILALVLFLWAAAVAADWANFGTEMVLVDLGLAALVGASLV